MKTRRLLLASLLLIFTYIIASAADYRVNVSSTLNVRSTPSTSASKIGTLSEGEIIHDAEQSSTAGWIEFDYYGEHGYVKTEYLQPIDSVTDSHAPLISTFDGNSLFKVFSEPGERNNTIAYIILGCALVMWFICKNVRKLVVNDLFTHRSVLHGGAMLFNIILLLATSGLIIYYVMSSGGCALWFMRPSMVQGPLNGWLYAIINFIIFTYVIINMLANLIKTMDDIGFKSNHVEYDLRFGLLTWGIGIIGFIVCGWWIEKWTNYLLLGLLACQIIQVCIILYQGLRRRAFFMSLVAVIVYVVGALGIVVMCVPLTMVLIMLFIAGVILTAISSGSGNETEPSGRIGPKYVTLQTSANGDLYYDDEDGTHFLYDSGLLRYDSDGNYYDERGNRR